MTSRTAIVVAVAAMACGACSKKSSEETGARPKHAKASQRKQTLPPALALPATPFAAFAAAWVSEGKVLWRGWMHVTLDGKRLGRFPSEWGVPYLAAVAILPGRKPAWVTNKGEVVHVVDGRPKVVAHDAEPLFPPCPGPSAGSLLYARKNGDIAAVAGGTARVFVAGDGTPVRSVVWDERHRRVAFIRGSSTLVVADPDGGTPKAVYRSGGPRARLFDARWLDGDLFARERIGSKGRLVRVRNGKPLPEVPLPPGVLRGVAVVPGSGLLVGLARRVGRRRVGEVYLQRADGSGRKKLFALERTLPAPRLGCGKRNFLLVDMSAPMWRLTSVPLAVKKPRRVLSPVNARLLGPRAWTLYCPP